MKKDRPIWDGLYAIGRRYIYVQMQQCPHFCGHRCEGSRWCADRQQSRVVVVYVMQEKEEIPLVGGFAADCRLGGR